MSISSQSPGDAPEGPSPWTAVLDSLALLWARRRFLAIAIGCGVVASVLLALVIPKEYDSTAQLLPPQPQSISGMPMLPTLGEGAATIASSMGSSFLGRQTPGDTAIGILQSATVQYDIVDRLNLKQVYHCKRDSDARTMLDSRSTIDQANNSGIVTITVQDRDPVRARDIAQAYVDDLSHLVTTLASSSARRERVFLENRLSSLRVDLGVDSKALSEFSSHTGTLNPERQGEAALQATTRLQGELITTEAQLSALRAVYADDNVRVRSLRAHVAMLESQLRKLSGQAPEGSATTAADTANSDALPSMRQLPGLAVTYSSLYRKVTMEESLFALLTKQYELAKVQEAKEISQIKVLDIPRIPDKKASPRRSLVVLGGTFFSALLAIAWVLFSRYRVAARNIIAEIRRKSEQTPE